MAQQRTRAAASETADQTRRVGLRAADEGQEVASTAKEEGRRVASTAAERAQHVAEATGEESKALVRSAKDQVTQVKDEASAQAQNVLDETRSRLQEQTATQAQRLAEGLSRLGEEALALSEGRVEDASTARDLVAQAADKLFGAADRASFLAEDVQNRGMEGLVDDLQRFARRRPGVFLFATAVAGFAAGRAVRMRDTEPVEPATTGTGTQGAVRPAPTRRVAAGGGR